MNILMIKLAALGDVVRTLALIPALKHKYPGSSISWLTSEASVPLFKLNPDIKNLFIIESQNEILISRLKQEKFNLVVNLDDDKEACRIATAVAIDEGHSAPVQNCQINGYYSKNNRIACTKETETWMKMSLLGGNDRDVLKAANTRTYQEIMCDIIQTPFDERYKPQLYLSPEEIASCQDMLAKQGVSGKDILIAVNTGAGRRWPMKILSTETTVQILRQLSLNGLIPVLCGGAAERDRNQTILNKSDGITVLNGFCDDDLRRFIALINACTAVISADTLALHIGIAMNKFTVGFFGSTPSREICFYGKGKAVCPETFDCLVCMRKTSCDRHPNCMEVISADELVSPVLSNLSKTSKAKIATLG